jgi:chorismate synthase
LAKLVLKGLGISVQAFTSQVGGVKLDEHYTAYDLSAVESNAVRCPDAGKAVEMEQLILDVKRQGDTVGGVVTCVVKGVPVGLGEPLYDKLSASLAGAMLSINAVKGFEYGNGFAAAAGRGSEQNDIFFNDGGKVATRSNNSGGIQGGISNGNDIYFRVAFKPVATLLMEQPTVTKDGNETLLLARGRHDPCVVPRAVPVVEAMAALVLLDHYMLDRARKF